MQAGLGGPVIGRMAIGLWRPLRPLSTWKLVCIVFQTSGPKQQGRAVALRQMADGRCRQVSLIWCLETYTRPTALSSRYGTCTAGLIALLSR